MYKRAEYQIIKRRLEEPRKFIQVVMGACQTGKSTIVKQVLKDLDMPFRFYSAAVASYLKKDCLNHWPDALRKYEWATG